MDVKYVQIIIKAADEVKSQKVDIKGIKRMIRYSDADYYIIDTEAFFDASPIRVRGRKIILCSVFGKRIGIMVDSIVEFISLDALFIEKNIDFNVFAKDRYVSWYLEYQDRKILYPNYEKIAKELSSSDFFLSLVF